MPSASAVFVPGSFSGPHLYGDLLALLKAQQCDVHCISLRSALPRDATPPGPPIPTMYDDAEVISAKVRELADQGRDVVVFAHSYGGSPATESLKGLSKASREAEGKRGGVVRIAFISCLVPDVGQAPGQLLDPKEGAQLPSEINEAGWMYHTDMETLARTSFSGMPHDQALEWAARLGWHSAASFASPLQYAGYEDVPVSWLLCEDDLVITKKHQQIAIDLIERKSGTKVDVTSIQAGHVPMNTDLETVVQWMVRLLEA